MKNPHRQLGLKAGNVERVVNVPDRKGLVPGNTMTLTDDPEVVWTIQWVSSNVRDKSTIKTNWNNNI